MNNEAAPVQPTARSRRGGSRTEFGGWRKEVWDWTKALLAAIVIVAALQTFVFQLSTVKMHSMEPTLYEKEWLFVNKISYRFGHPSRGDVVILKDPSATAGRKKFLVKRIVGIPGDKLEIRNKQLYLNGKLQIEPYTDTDVEDGDYGPVTVGAGHYFVMGDNRHAGASKDSRSFQEVPENTIKGRAEAIIWPVVRWAGL